MTVNCTVWFVEVADGVESDIVSLTLCKYAALATDGREKSETKNTEHTILTATDNVSLRYTSLHKKLIALIILLPVFKIYDNTAL